MWTAMRRPRIPEAWKGLGDYEELIELVTAITGQAEDDVGATKEAITTDVMFRILNHGKGSLRPS